MPELPESSHPCWHRRHHRRRRQVPLPALVLLSGAALACPVGCASPAPRPKPEAYQTVAKDPHHDADLARRENARAAALLDQADQDDAKDPAASTSADLSAAEAALKAALEADVTCGPAHNNLGKVYYRQGKLYLAAWEFQYAMKLMPNQPEPPNNLGLVYEAAGKLDEAADAYGKAVALEPDNVQALGNLARAKVRRGDRDSSVRALLHKLVLRDTRPEWLAWERKSLARLDAAVPESPPEPPGAREEKAGGDGEKEAR